MLIRRSTVVLVFLFAVGSAQARTVATRAHAVTAKPTGHLLGSAFTVPLIAHSPLNWGQSPQAVAPLRLLSTLAEPVSPRLVMLPAATNTGINTGIEPATSGMLSVSVLAPSSLNWGQGPVAVSHKLPSMLLGSTAAGLSVARATSPEPASVLSAGLVDSSGASVQSAADDAADTVTGLRDALVQLAMSLRDIPYVSGGDTPSTGFDCSGFVRYVFAHAVGMRLPTNAASQFLHGLKVSRTRLKTGDLVFFHTSGKRRISHVGIYLSNGRFIHAPTSGKSVEVSSLHESYWSKHFAGAKRPEAIVAAASNG